MIQDLIFAAGSLIFIISLLPTLLNKNSQIPLTTSIPTAVILYIFAATYYSLGLYLAVITSFATAVMWTIIAIWRKP